MLVSDHRSHSRPLDIHTWSDHPEINIIVDKVWHSLGQYRQANLTPKGNRKGTDPKLIIKVLLVHLYETFLDDPALWTGVPRSANAYAPTSRYNSLNVSFKIIQLIDGLVELGYLEFVGGSNDKTYDGWNSFTSRIRPSHILKVEFAKCTAEQFDIYKHKSKVAVLLSDFDTDIEGKLIRRRGKRLKQLIEYEDTDETQRMELMLYAYNSLLQKAYIDIATLEKTYIERETKVGIQRIPINQNNKFVSRIFSRGSWTNNGWFYGGFWQHLGRSYRKDIFINNKPTIEVDSKGIHPSILSINKGKASIVYELDEVILPGLNKKQQTKALKLLILTALSASSKRQAYEAFRASSDLPLKDRELSKLINSFIELNPHLADELFTAQLVNLMYQDSLITEYVIKKFTYSDVPILSVHDSFIVQYDQILTLKKYMGEASKAVLGKQLNYERDFYNYTETLQFKDIDQGYYNTLMNNPPKVETTERYERTYNKFRLWIERNNQGNKPYRVVGGWKGQQVE